MKIIYLGLIIILLAAILFLWPRYNQKDMKIFQTSFENISDFSSFYLTPQNHLNSTRHELSTEQVHSGIYSHKAWMTAANEIVSGQNTNHRGYPTIQLYKTVGVFSKKVLIEFWVWLDIDLKNQPNQDWFSFATLTSYADDLWSRTILVNLDYNNIIHLMHIPDQQKKEPDIFQTQVIKFPMKQWVKITIFLDYTQDNQYKNPYVKVWQNDELVSASRFNPRINPATVAKSLWPDCLAGWDEKSIDQVENLCDLNYAGGLAQAHFGLYAPPLLSAGTVYNDDLIIRELGDSPKF